MKHLVLPVLILGCAEPGELAQVEQALGCSEIWCGMNSSKLGSIYTHELRIDGVPNNEGFSITRVEQYNEDYELAVKGGQFVLYNAQGDVSGSDVVDALIFIEHIDGGSYVIRIEDTDLTPYWAKTDARMRTYRLSWSDVSGGVIVNEWTNVCSNPPDSKYTGDMDAFSVVVFEGDRVDGKAKTVGKPDTRYFNIGCTGHALAKMALTGHSFPGAFDLTTTVEQRQTFLKMVTGDYCGDGTAFTVPGTPLDWTADQQWLPYHFTDLSLEGRWTHKGASCISKFRLDATSDPTGGGMFPNGVTQAIADHCYRTAPRLCTNEDAEDLDGHYMVSAIPY